MRQLREPEVEHLGLAVLGHEDVGRRDVPVDDALGMGGDQRIGDLGADPEHVGDRELPRLHRSRSVRPLSNSITR